MRFFKNESGTFITSTTDPDFIVSSSLIEITAEEYKTLSKEQQRRRLMEQLAMLEE